MDNKAALKALLETEAKLKKRLAVTESAIRVMGARYSKERGFVFPLTREKLERELKNDLSSDTSLSPAA